MYIPLPVQKSRPVAGQMRSVSEAWEASLNERGLPYLNTAAGVNNVVSAVHSLNTNFKLLFGCEDVRLLFR